MACERATLGALHHLVDVVVHNHVQRVGTRRAHPATDEGEQDEGEVDMATVGLQQRRDRGYQK